MRSCPNCQKPIRSERADCPRCGAHLEDQSPAASAGAGDGLAWKIRVAGTEYTAQGAAQLREWYREGRFAATDYVFHPLFEKWQHASDTVELEGAIPSESPAEAGAGGIPTPPTPLVVLGCLATPFVGIAVVVGFLALGSALPSSITDKAPRVARAVPDLTVADITWDDSTRGYEDLIVEAVNRIQRTIPDCDVADRFSISRSPSQSTPANPIFFVTCNARPLDSYRSFNVWFDREGRVVQVGPRAWLGERSN